MVHQDGKTVKSVKRYLEVGNAHVDCELKDWPDEMELKNPPLLSLSQAEVVLDLDNGWQKVAIQRHTGESDQCFQWRQFYKKLYPEVHDDHIPRPSCKNPESSDIHTMRISTLTKSQPSRSTCQGPSTSSP
jgi:hypothetical protein